MMILEQDMNYEGANDLVKRMVADLKEWHQEHPFANGIDWAMQTYWAKMDDTDCVAFCLKYPEHADKFRRI